MALLKFQGWGKKQAFPMLSLWYLSAVPQPLEYQHINSSRVEMGFRGEPTAG